MNSTWLRAVLGAVAVFAAAPAIADPPAPAGPLKLNLTCTGTLETAEMDETSVTVAKDFDATQSATGKATTTRLVRIPGRLTFEFADGAGRVRVPPQWRPRFSKRAADGWMDLDQFAADDRTVTGRLSLNFISKPHLRIDRRTGDVELGSFVGTCDRTPDGAAAQRF